MAALAILVKHERCGKSKTAGSGGINDDPLVLEEEEWTNKRSTRMAGRVIPFLCCTIRPDSILESSCSVFRLSAQVVHSSDVASLRESALPKTFYDTLRLTLSSSS